mgnify:CR=1 FL=1
MRCSIRNVTRAAILAAAGGVIASATISLADPPTGGCPRNILCIEVYDPVVCSDGNTYPNSCYAWKACATGCVRIGPGPVPLDLD